MFGSFLPMVIFFYSRFLRLDLEPFVTARFSRSDLGSCVLGFHFALERFPLGFWTTSVHAPGPDPRLPLGPARQKRACIRLVFPPTDLLFPAVRRAFRARKFPPRSLPADLGNKCGPSVSVVQSSSSSRRSARVLHLDFLVAGCLLGPFFVSGFHRCLRS
jgi:hypothetical protein